MRWPYRLPTRLFVHGVNLMPREFTDSPAVRSQVPLLVGLVSPSGGGKTFSGLRLATGMQSVIGGDIYGIDTEASRMKHYADQFRFRHVPFKAPFDPLSYLAAVEHCAKNGAKIIIIDSASHMHEGPGGTLEAHAAEVERIAAAWKCDHNKALIPAWAKPKGDLRRFLNSILQLEVNLIFCFRAKDKIKVIPGKQPQQLGYMPIAGEEMIFEMTLNCLLYPNSGGVPTWQPDEMGEKAIIKLPQQFRSIFETKQPLSEDIGRQLAEWARGGKPVDPIEAGRAAAGNGTEALKAWFQTLSQADKKRLKPALDGELKTIAAAADAETPTEEMDEAGPIPPPSGKLFNDGSNPAK